jgi:hypothetical protein
MLSFPHKVALVKTSSEIKLKTSWMQVVRNNDLIYTSDLPTKGSFLSNNSKKNPKRSIAQNVFNYS